MADPDAMQLFQQAVLAAKRKDLENARKLIKASIRKQPKNETAWLVYASIAETKREQLICLKQVLELNPQNAQAAKMVRDMGIDPRQLIAPPKSAQSQPQPAPQQAPEPTRTAESDFMRDLDDLRGTADFDDLDEVAETPDEVTDAPAPAEPAAVAPLKPIEPKQPERDPRQPPPPKHRPASFEERLRVAADEAEGYAADYLKPPSSFGNIQWVKKEKNRAGENEIVVVRAAVVAAIALLSLIPIVILTSVIASNRDLRYTLLTYIDSDLAGTATQQKFLELRFGPTVTPTGYVPPTASPGFAATDTPFPTELPQDAPTLTPVPSIPPELPSGDLLVAAPTEIDLPGVPGAARDVIRLAGSGEIEPAISTAQAEIEVQGAQAFDGNIYYSIAIAQILAGEPDAALDTVQQAEARRLELASDNSSDEAAIKAGLAAANLALAKQALQTGEGAPNSYYSQVDPNAERAITLAPDWAEPRLTLIERYILSQNYTQAQNRINSARERPDMRADARFLVFEGEIAFQQGRYDEAANFASLAVYVDPFNADARDLQTRAALEGDNPVLASVYAQGYAFYYPLLPRAWELLAQARLKEGDPAKAMEAYTRAIEIAEAEPNVPTPIEAYLARAERYETRGQFAQAAADIGIVANATGDDELRVRQLYLSLSAEDYDLAQELTANLAEDGIIQQGFANYVEARALAATATDEAPLTTDQFEQIATLLDVGVSQIPERYRADAHLLRAIAYLETDGDTNNALNFVDSSLSSQENIFARLVRGQALEALERYEDALKEYEQVITWSQLLPAAEQQHISEASAGITRVQTLLAEQEQAEQ